MLSQERENSQFKQGMQRLGEGKRQEALQHFLICIEQHPHHCCESHFECGEIYLAFYHDPIASIYHYRHYLLQQPNSPQASLVRQRIETAEKAFVEQIPALKSLQRESHRDLLKTIKMLQDENNRLKKQLASTLIKCEKLSQFVPTEELSKTNSENTHQYMTAATAPKSAANRRENYVVRSGDTLSSISHKVYGEPSRWKEIFDANRHLLKSPSNLKIGQELIIPR